MLIYDFVGCPFMILLNLISTFSAGSDIANGCDFRMASHYDLFDVSLAVLLAVL
jgi:hypothetical protein